jgi:hypothetical protein
LAGAGRELADIEEPVARLDDMQRLRADFARNQRMNAKPPRTSSPAASKARPLQPWAHPKPRPLFFPCQASAGFDPCPDQACFRPGSRLAPSSRYRPITSG